MRNKLTFALILVLAFVGIGWADSTLPGALRAPTVKTGAVTTSIYWTAGTVANGGDSVAITAGSHALDASETSCAAPLYSACDILYANSSGTVDLTTDIYTASASGNVILAFIETNGSSVPTNIVLGSQNGAVSLAASGSRVASVSTAAAGSVLGAIRGQVNAVGAGSAITSGTLVGARGAVTVTNGVNVGSGVFLYGSQGKLITGTATIDVGSGFAVGLFGQLDVSGATLTSGHIAAVSGDIFGFNSGSNSYVDMVYVQAAGGGVINSMFKAFGKATYVFDIGTNVHTQASTSCTPSAVTGATGGLKVNVDGTTRWIPLAATCT